VVGEVPFDAGNYNALLQIIISRPPAPPHARGVNLSPAVEQVIMAALSKRRDERPPNARVLRELLLEAGMQANDVQLEPASWKFRSIPALPSLARGSLPPSAKDPGALEADIFKPARTTGSFAMPSRAPRAPQAAWGGGGAKPGVSSLAPRGLKSVPGPPQRLSMPAAPVRPPPPPPAQALLAASTRQSFPSLALEAEAASRAPGPPRPIELADLPRGPAHTAAKTMARGGPGQRPAAVTRSKAKRSVVGSIFGWLLVLGAIAALVYVGSGIFKRPDARKHRKAAETLAPEPGPTAPPTP
jgi:serine/threonine-protein kinase